LAVDPADPDTIVVSAATSPFTAHMAEQGDATVYRRSGEEPWHEVRDGLPEPAGATRAALAANPAEPGVFYAATNRGVYRSADASLQTSLPLARRVGEGVPDRSTGVAASIRTPHQPPPQGGEEPFLSRPTHARTAVRSADASLQTSLPPAGRVGEGVFR